MNQERASIRGVVETVFCSGPSFSAGRLRAANGAVVKFAGKVFVKESDPVRLEGRWVDHPKYGRQFEAEFMGHDLEMNPEGLANVLANHPDLKGIGPAKARLIADHFGLGFDAAIRTDPETVATVAKVPIENILDLQRIRIANSDFKTAMAYLAAFGLTHHQVTTLVGKFGSQVVPILERDPYVLMREIPGFGFKRVDKIARKMGTPKDLPSRIRAGIHYCVLDALDDGDCWVEYEDLLYRANTLLVMDIQYVRRFHPSAAFECLWPLDANQGKPAPGPAFRALNFHVNLPDEWRTSAYGVKFFRSEGFDYDVWQKNARLLRQTLALIPRQLLSRNRQGAVR